MSHRAANWAMRQVPGQSGQGHVLKVLADYHNEETGIVCPSATTVATLTGQGERTVREHLKALQADGFLWIYERRGTSPLIEFNWHRPTPETVKQLVRGVKLKRKGTPAEMAGAVNWTPGELEELRAWEAGKSTPAEMAGVQKTPAENDTTPAENDTTPAVFAGTPAKTADEPIINHNNNNTHAITKDWQPADSALAKCPSGIPAATLQSFIDKFVDYWTKRGKRKNRPADEWGELFVKHCRKNWKFTNGQGSEELKRADPSRQSTSAGASIGAGEVDALAANDLKLQQQLAKEGKPDPFRTGTDN